MKRKYSHIALAILLLAGSSGFTVNAHFCGEILKAFTINAPSPDCCDTMEMPADCCHDESEHFEVDEFQVQQTNLSLTINAPLLYVIDYFLVSGLFPEVTSSQLFIEAKSPPTTESKIFIRIQSFLL